VAQVKEVGAMADLAAFEVPQDLAELAAVFAASLREYFGREGERLRQVLALAEEAGEFVAAYRRWAGMARRSGDRGEVEAELADVVIAAYVTAHVLGLDVDHRFGLATPVGDPSLAALNVAAATAWVAECVVHGLADDVGSALETVVATARHAAGVLDIDLDAAIGAKAQRIAARGWRDPA
jgi:NTP pyrophosphatase (non-canonical NTP hydrolase)